MTALAPEARAAQEFGGKLYEALFTEDARIALRRTFDQAAMQNKGVRIRLRLEAVPELADLPWEFLYAESTRRFLALSPDTPILRYLEMPEPTRPLVIQPPLRILAVFASPREFAPLDVEREWQALNNALGDLTARGRVQLQRLEPATLENLQDMMRRSEIHILHFTGHGGFDIDRGAGFLLVEDERGNARQLDAQRLGTLLGDGETLRYRDSQMLGTLPRDSKSLRLVTLMTRQGTRDVTAPFLRIAPGLVRQGVPAVVGMHFELSDRAALYFAREFYGALADNEPVDVAMSRAREAIYSYLNQMEWATPVLYTSARDGILFDVQQLPVRPEPVSPIIERSVKAETTKPKPARKTKAAKGKTTRTKAARKTAEVETTELPPNTRLQNRYRILKKISESDRSTVYLVRDERLGAKACVLKELKTGTKNLEPHQRELFKQNVEMLTRLSHPSLPRVTDYFEAEARLYYAMDFIEGNTLENLLAQNGKPFAVDQVLKWADELCHALTYMHQQTPPFIHGNISPEHILRAKDGVAVLLGFDLVELHRGTKIFGDVVFGTLGYIAPELYSAPEQTEAHFNVQSDIYALGVTLHHLLTMHDPTESLFDLPPIRKLNSSVPEHIASALAVAYVTDPKERYASASDFQRALQEPPQKNLLDRLLRR